jgi:hypothetical protein
MADGSGNGRATMAHASCTAGAHAHAQVPAAGDSCGDERGPEACRGIEESCCPDPDQGSKKGEVGHSAHEIAGVMIAPAGAGQAREEHDAGKEAPQFVAGAGLKLVDGRADSASGTPARHLGATGFRV